MTKLDKLLEDLINAESCPQCDNSGSYPGGNEETGVEECKCQFCYTQENGIFNRRFAIIQYVRDLKAITIPDCGACEVARGKNYCPFTRESAECKTVVRNMK